MIRPLSRPSISSGRRLLQVQSTLHTNGITRDAAERLLVAADRCSLWRRFRDRPGENTRDLSIAGIYIIHLTDRGKR